MAALKGAFINLGAGLLGAVPNIVVFQYNPDRVTRTPRTANDPGSASGRRDGRRQTGPPSERFDFTLNVDATDQLAESGGFAAATRVIAAASGILPTLSALEMLMVPKASLTIDLWRAAGGSAPYQLPPQRLPTVLLFWGPLRIWPVNVTSLAISETQYDTKLMPIRAEVEVSLRVLTPNQLVGDKIASGAYKYSQAAKEALAAINIANSANTVIGELPSLR